MKSIYGFAKPLIVWIKLSVRNWFVPRDSATTCKQVYKIQLPLSRRSSGTLSCDDKSSEIEVEEQLLKQLDQDQKCESDIKCSDSIKPKREIRFYNKDEEYYEFTNFAEYPVWYNEYVYPTSEHLFQSLKFEDPKDRDIIRTKKTAREAMTAARSMSDRVREGWVSKRLNIASMEKALLLKFTQYEDLLHLLLETEDALLIEDSPVDSFWGIGSDEKGKNQLGLSLMKVRNLLKCYQQPS